MGNNFSKIAIWVVVVLVLFAVFKQFNSSGVSSGATSIAYSEFIDKVRAKEIKDATLEDRGIIATTQDGKKVKTGITSLDRGLIGDLLNNGVKFDIKQPEEPSFLSQIFISWFPMLLLIGVWIFFMRQMQGGGKGGAFSFGRSKARMLDEASNTVTFADVAGCDEAKEEVQELVDFLRDPTKFQKLGGRIPRGVLMVGPPGTGKTLLARAIAGEAKVPFFTISGSDFVEMFVGVGASRVRDMFENAKKHAPCIVFIDEIDAVGRHRGAGMGGGNDEREQTLNQLLVEMDGFEANSGVIVIAATNRADVLDKALLRPGRFDRQVMVGLPDIRGREQILYVHMRKVPIAPDVRADILARGTPGFSGADLANLVNEAALFAARRNKRLVEMQDFEEAKDKIVMGPERKSAVMREEERRNTAYHESGHAVVAKLLPKADPVHKVTIMPRGYALGLTWQLPEHDRVNMYKDKMLEEISILFGGRISEEIFMHQMSTGASNDFERATKLARAMVTRYGMSEMLGTMVYEDTEQDNYFGRMSSKTVSEATQQKVDAEIRRILDEQYALSRRLLEENKDKVDLMARTLLEWETIDADQINDIMEGREPRLPKSGPPARRSSPDSTGGMPPNAPVPACSESGSVSKKGEETSSPFFISPCKRKALPRDPCQNSENSSSRSGFITSSKFMPQSELQIGRYRFAWGDDQRPLVMGVLNLTPDSFSDGGRFHSLDAAISHAERMIADGVDIIDIGGESSRPGAQPLPADEELRRIMPALHALRDCGKPLSVDTCKPEVMREAIDAGADMINDINGFRAHGALPAVKESGCGLCIMHMLGDPRTMQADPQYEDVVAEVAAFLRRRADEFQVAGIGRERLCVDPGFGFGKTLAHNLALLSHLGDIRRELGLPVLAGLSRKSTIGALTGKPMERRLAGSIAAALAAVARGANIVRVHDVAETVDALKVWQVVFSMGNQR